MNRLNKMVLIGLAAFAPMLAQAEGKIAILNIQQAMLSSDLAQARLKEFQAQPSVSGNIQEMEGLQKKYKDTVKQLQKDSAMMSAEQKAVESKKLADMRADMEHVARKLKAAEQEMSQALMQEFGPILNSVVQEIIKSEDIGLLLDSKAALHADVSFNISAKVTDKLNQSK